MRILSPSALVVAMAFVGCSSRKLDPTEVCRELSVVGVARRCRVEPAEGQLSRAVERMVFDIEGAPGETGQILQMRDRESYDAALGVLEKPGLVDGPVCATSAANLIIVQLAGAKAPQVEAARAAVAKLESTPARPGTSSTAR